MLERAYTRSTYQTARPTASAALPNPNMPVPNALAVASPFCRLPLLHQICASECPQTLRRAGSALTAYCQVLRATPSGHPCGVQSQTHLPGGCRARRARHTAAASHLSVQLLSRTSCNAGMAKQGQRSRQSHVATLKLTIDQPPDAFKAQEAVAVKHKKLLLLRPPRP